MKHGNKHWEREKLFRALRMEFLGRDVSESRDAWISSYFDNNFYEWNVYYNSAPKYFRKMLNRVRRAKQKQTLHKILKGYNAEFDDNYKDAAWLYW